MNTGHIVHFYYQSSFRLSEFCLFLKQLIIRVHCYCSFLILLSEVTALHRSLASNGCCGQHSLNCSMLLAPDSPSSHKLPTKLENHLFQASHRLFVHGSLPKVGEHSKCREETMQVSFECGFLLIPALIEHDAVTCFAKVIHKGFSTIRDVLFQPFKAVLHVSDWQESQNVQQPTEQFEALIFLVQTHKVQLLKFAPCALSQMIETSANLHMLTSTAVTAAMTACSKSQSSSSGV